MTLAEFVLQPGSLIVLAVIAVASWWLVRELRAGRTTADIKAATPRVQAVDVMPDIKTVVTVVMGPTVTGQWAAKVESDGPVCRTRTADALRDLADSIDPYGGDQ